MKKLLSILFLLIPNISFCNNTMNIYNNQPIEQFEKNLIKSQVDDDLKNIEYYEQLKNNPNYKSIFVDRSGFSNNYSEHDDYKISGDNQEDLDYITYFLEYYKNKDVNKVRKEFFSKLYNTDGLLKYAGNYKCYDNVAKEYFPTMNEFIQYNILLIKSMDLNKSKVSGIEFFNNIKTEDLMFLEKEYFYKELYFNKIPKRFYKRTGISIPMRTVMVYKCVTPKQYDNYFSYKNTNYRLKSEYEYNTYKNRVQGINNSYDKKTLNTIIETQINYYNVCVNVRNHYQINNNYKSSLQSCINHMKPIVEAQKNNYMKIVKQKYSGLNLKIDNKTIEQMMNKEYIELCDYIIKTQIDRMNSVEEECSQMFIENLENN